MPPVSGNKLPQESHPWRVTWDIAIGMILAALLWAVFIQGRPCTCTSGGQGVQASPE